MLFVCVCEIPTLNLLILASRSVRGFSWLEVSSAIRVLHCCSFSWTQMEECNNMLQLHRAIFTSWQWVKWVGYCMCVPSSALLHLWWLATVAPGCWRARCFPLWANSESTTYMPYMFYMLHDKTTPLCFYGVVGCGGMFCLFNATVVDA